MRSSISLTLRKEVSQNQSYNGNANTWYTLAIAFLVFFFILFHFLLANDLVYMYHASEL